MLLQPKYPENIVVAIKWQKTFYWYVTQPQLWYMDLQKLEEHFREPLFWGQRIPHMMLGDFDLEEQGHLFLNERNAPLVKTRMERYYHTVHALNPQRQDIPVLSQKTIPAFLPRIEPFRTNGQELIDSLLSQIKDRTMMQISEDYEPLLFINFDKRRLYTKYFGKFTFGHDLPRSWKGVWCFVPDRIPKDQRFWVDPAGHLLFDFRRWQPRN
jgi:hypothetical protein